MHPLLVNKKLFNVGIGPLKTQLSWGIDNASLELSVTFLDLFLAHDCYITVFGVNLWLLSFSIYLDWLK